MAPLKANAADRGECPRCRRKLNPLYFDAGKNESSIPPREKEMLDRRRRDPRRSEPR